MSCLASIFSVTAPVLLASVLSELMYCVLNCGLPLVATPRGLCFRGSQHRDML